MNYTLSHSDNTSFLDLTGRLTAVHVDELKSVFMMLIANNNYAVVNLDDVTAMDPICLQFFCMAIKGARSLGKKVILRGQDALMERQSMDGPAVICSGNCPHSLRNCYEREFQNKRKITADGSSNI